MSWAVQDFLEQVLGSLNAQGYSVEVLTSPYPLGERVGTWRCGLASKQEGMPSSVILKRAGEDSPWRWQDWTCQYLLSDQPGLKGLGPEFFAADERIGYYLLEDLGLGADLGMALQHRDSRGRLAAGLLACALAGLHAGTFGREAVFAVLRERLPGSSPDRRAEQAEWRAQVEPALQRLRPGLAAELEPLLATLQDEMAEPAEFLTLTHGDWDACKVWYGDAGPRFLDFCNGGFRHALLDLVAWERRCAGHPAASETLWREYMQELDRLGAARGPRFIQAHARARAWMGLHRLAQGDDLAGGRHLLRLAVDEDELKPLQAVLDLL